MSNPKETSTMPQIIVQLSTVSGRSFVSHRVRAAFAQFTQVEGSETRIQIPGETSTTVDSSGRAVLTLPDRDQLVEGSLIVLRVISPDGEVLIETPVDHSVLGADEPVSIEVNPREIFTTEPSTDPAFGRPNRIRGFVVDPSGQQTNLGNLQVVIWAKPVTPESAPFEIVATSYTDAQGYFSAPYPLGPFLEAQGLVGSRSQDSVPIRLNEDGSFPERFVLGVDLSTTVTRHANGEVPRHPDCGDLVNSPATYTNDLGGGHCIDLTKPNRVIEEFDYYTVVRTTEPSIQGLTVAEPPKINLSDVIGVLDPKILQLLQRSQQPSTQLLAVSQPNTAPMNPQSLMGGTQPPSGFNINVSEAIANRVLADNQLEIEHLAEAASLAALRLVQTEAARITNNPSVTPAPGVDINNVVNLQSVRIEAEIVKTLTRDPDGFSLTRLASAELLTRKNDLVRLLDLIKRGSPGRGELNCRNSVDWDDEPTFYQSCSIAHGHILHLKEEWVADGYSLGDLLYSLPLAPCQKKQIAVIDWDRRESAARQESLEQQEFLSAQLSRDRDVSEIANALVRESMSGGSEASTGSFGGGLGVGGIFKAVGALLGIGGGTSKASSTAWQNSSRGTSANSLQQLRDRVSQAASSVRAQRSTVIQTVRQGETMRVQTEVVANHNHCHAITIQYFEVLRHFLVRHQLADVQECLLVPLLISRFDAAKARRWREPLSRYLRNRQFLRGFDALQRIADNYVGSDMPSGAYAENQLEYLDGYLRIQFRIQRPRDNEGEFLEAAWAPLAWLGIQPHEWWRSYLENQQQRDRIFAEILGPRIAEEIVNGLRFIAVDDSDTPIPLPIDPTLISDFQNDQAMYVSLRLSADLPPLRRDRIKFIKIDTTINTNAGPRNIDDILPTGSKIIVHSGQMAYRTVHLSHNLFNQARILNDLSGTDGVLIYTPLSRQELRRPREEDKEYANSLLKHLNDHLEYYHRAIWWSMDAQRRFMLLDGFIAPNSGGRSVASVVENRLIGILGNCLVMPVVRGTHLDPTFNQDQENPIDLLEHYQPTTPIAPQCIAIPTKGVFAESILGSCNSCEKIDESRFWRWSEEPCPDDPPAIQPVSTDSRRSEPPNLEAKDFAAPIVAFQNLPSAPDPQGFGGLLELLGNPNLFRDLSGLTENQKNALAGLQAALGSAQFFGGKAADLALQGNMRQDIDRALSRINDQHRSGAISDQQRAQLTESALRSMIGGGAQTTPEPVTTQQVQDLTSAAGANDASISVSRPTGEQVSIDARPNGGSLEDNTRATILLPAARSSPDVRAFFPSRRDISGIIELEAVVRNTPAGSTYRWTRPDPTALSIDSPTSPRTRVLGIRPGQTEIHFAVSDAGGTAVASVRLQLCVPQFISVNEDAAAFNAVLASIHLDHVKDEVLRVAKAVCDRVLSTANVRTVWRLTPFSEALPAHLPVGSITTLTIRGEPPEAGLLGRTNFVGGTAGATVFNETIDIFPGGYDDAVPGGSPSEVDLETQALVVQLESMTFTDPQLEQFAIQVFGRLIGETIAHEIVHSLLAFDIPSGHNSPAIANDLMNYGFERTFRQRTGFEDTTRTSPVNPSNFVDHGIEAIGGLQTENQGRMDARFPVPPAFT
jgi:hypothetical protein